MNFSGSVTDFFYNIVPGSLFLFCLRYLHLDRLQFLGLGSIDPATLIFAYIILGLFLGFVFQSITKFARKSLGWNQKVVLKVKNKNIHQFLKIYDFLYDKKYKEDDHESLTNVFYLMDCNIRGESASFLPTHFSSRFAFWSNILIGIIIILILRLINSQPFDGVYAGLIISGAWSYWCAEDYFENFYDSILKCYYVRNKSEMN